MLETLAWILVNKETNMPVLEDGQYVSYKNRRSARRDKNVDEKVVRILMAQYD